MGTQAVASILEYLRALAPDFFAARVRSATDADIARLERTARTPMSHGHREFLREMGNTNTTVLNPFLNDHDWAIDTLIEQYEWLRSSGFTLPPRVVHFSTSEVSGVEVLLRHGDAAGDDPEVGDIVPETRQFKLLREVHFESFLRAYAFHFRMAQPEHQLDVSPPWNAEAERFEGDAKRCRQLLRDRGFHLVFAIDDGTECLERDDMATRVFNDGSMALTGDDLDDLTRLAEGLQAELPLEWARSPARGRMRAPKA